MKARSGFGRRENRWLLRNERLGQHWMPGKHLQGCTNRPDDCFGRGGVSDPTLMVAHVDGCNGQRDVTSQAYSCPKFSEWKQADNARCNAALPLTKGSRPPEHKSAIKRGPNPVGNRRGSMSFPCSTVEVNDIVHRYRGCKCARHNRAGELVPTIRLAKAFTNIYSSFFEAGEKIRPETEARISAVNRCRAFLRHQGSIHEMVRRHAVHKEAISKYGATSAG